MIIIIMSKKRMDVWLSAGEIIPYFRFQLGGETEIIFHGANDFFSFSFLFVIFLFLCTKGVYMFFISASVYGMVL